MPVVIYSTYIPVSDSGREIAAQEHRLGRSLLYDGLLSLYGLTVSPEDIAVGKNGKPYLMSAPDIHFNISHCSGLAACAFDNEPIGTDAELIGYFAEILIKRTLSEAEKHFLADIALDENERNEWFYRFWTLKEAYVKRTGIGVDTDLTAFSFFFNGPPEDPASDIICSAPAVSCFQKKLESGHIISVCCSGTCKDIVLLKHQGNPQFTF
ncbi:MAG: 4'-phosphopantetheinyl transferase superfamily protein [Blautia sp.]|nr:4'-phosphopantetheinyl transferase superfamily protein [Blautia sp.]